MPFLDEDLVTTADEAQAKCAAEGGRLWQPRTKQGYDAMKARFAYHLDQVGFDAPAFYFGVKALAAPNGTLYLAYTDGNQVPKEVYHFLERGEDLMDGDCGAWLNTNEVHFHPCAGWLVIHTKHPGCLTFKIPTWRVLALSS